MRDDYLKLYLNSSITAASFHKIAKQYNHNYTAVAQNTKCANDEELNAYMSKLKTLNANIITMLDNNYPEKLKQLSSPPPVIHYIGNIELLNKENISIIGTRNASIHGIEMAQNIVQDNIDKVVVSGMAKGIDKAAHEAAKHTIGVISHGIDITYPKENKPLYEKLIQENNLIISLERLQQRPLPQLFAKRNAIIAILADVIIVIEASLKSGTMLTANMGVKYGKKIYAVPGWPTDERSQGANMLIANNKAEMLCDTKINKHTNKTFEQQKFDFDTLMNEEVSNEQNYKNQIKALISKTPIHIDKLIENLNISPQETQILISDMEIEKEILVLPNKTVCILE